MTHSGSDVFYKVSKSSQIFVKMKSNYLSQMSVHYSVGDNKWLSRTEENLFSAQDTGWIEDIRQYGKNEITCHVRNMGDNKESGLVKDKFLQVMTDEELDNIIKTQKDNTQWNELKKQYLADSLKFDRKKKSDKNILQVNNTVETAENLKLRKKEGTDSSVITVIPAGTKITIMGLGNDETIDTIKSKWIKVRILAGQKDLTGQYYVNDVEGWCFGGYLRPTDIPRFFESNPELRNLYIGKKLKGITFYRWKGWNNSFNLATSTRVCELEMPVHHRIEYNGYTYDSQRTAEYDEWENMYAPGNAFDNNVNTAWCEGVFGDGEGEVVLAYVDTNKPLQIRGGYAKSQKDYKNNNRPKQIKVWILEKDSFFRTNEIKVIACHELELKDINDWQKLDIPQYTAPKDKKIYIGIEIVSVYKGKSNYTFITDIGNIPEE